MLFVALSFSKFNPASIKSAKLRPSIPDSSKFRKYFKISGFTHSDSNESKKLIKFFCELFDLVSSKRPIIAFGIFLRRVIDDNLS